MLKNISEFRYLGKYLVGTRGNKSLLQVPNIWVNFNGLISGVLIQHPIGLGCFISLNCLMGVMGMKWFNIADVSCKKSIVNDELMSNDWWQIERKVASCRSGLILTYLKFPCEIYKMDRIDLLVLTIFQMESWQKWII